MYHLKNPVLLSVKYDYELQTRNDHVAGLICGQQPTLNFYIIFNII
jgi:hypothetical protein